MKLYAEPVEIESSGTFEGRSATIKASAHAFSVLSKGLYSNPILAIVRELCCNAYDSHVAAGKSEVPFHLYLPNSLETTFKIRDFGTGLASDEAVYRMYDYFDSSKQHTNEMTGCFGLGAKSPFSVTKKFTTVNYRDGKATTYINFLNEQGIPDILKTSEQETTEPNGLEISFACNVHDVNAFVSNAQMALLVFKTKPKIFGLHNVEKFMSQLNCGTPELTGPDFSLFGTDPYPAGSRLFAVMGGTDPYPAGSRLFAVMGNVAYPITSQSGFSQHAKKVVLYLRGFIDFSLGSFSVTPSRESIQWTDFSVANINDKLEEVADFIQEHVFTMIDKEEYPWAARIKAQFMYNGQFSEFVQGTLKWRGEPLPVQFRFPTSPTLEVRAYSKSRRFWSRKLREWTTRLSMSDNLGATSVEPTANVKFALADYKGAFHKIETHIREDAVDNTYYVFYHQQLKTKKVKNPKSGAEEEESYYVVDYEKAFDTAEIAKSLGIPEDQIFRISSLPDKPRQATTRTARLSNSKARAFTLDTNAVMTEGKKALDTYWDEAEIDLAAGGVYTEISHWQLVNAMLASHPADNIKVFTALTNLGCLPTIIGVKSVNLEKFSKLPNWKTFEQYLNEKTREFWDSDDFQVAHTVLCTNRWGNDAMSLSCAEDQRQFFTALSALKRKDANSKFANRMARMDAVLALQNKVIAFNTILERLYGTAQFQVRAQNKTAAETLVEECVTSYPMLVALHNMSEIYDDRSFRRANGFYDPMFEDYVQLCDNAAGV